MTIQCCILLPCFQHARFIESVIQQVLVYQLPILIIDDGGNTEEQALLSDIARRYPSVSIERLPYNKGKGAALSKGFHWAHTQGFTHALQVDADGQHDMARIAILLQEAQQHPQMLISGKPQYDASVPKKRLYGRYVTHICVWLETLSFAIPDSMCGFRVYPVAPTVELFARYRIGKRMDFDTEFMVRWFWEGHNVRFVEVAVHYPEAGISNFRAVADNIAISWMHTRLLFGMIPRIPSLLLRKKMPHWTQQTEQGSMFWMRCAFWCYQRFGYGAIAFLLKPVSLFYWLFSGSQRRASQQFLQQRALFLSQKGQSSERYSSLQHFYQFTLTLLEKVASWHGDLRYGQEIHFTPGSIEQFDTTQGTVILTSHLGNIEGARAIAKAHPNIVVNALVFHQNSQKFVQFLQQINPDAGIHLIEVDTIGPETILMLQEKIQRGEHIAIMADRHFHQNASDRQVMRVPFLGKEAVFPMGPYVIASLLQCPVKLMFGIRSGRQSHLYCEHFSDAITIRRTHRKEDVLPYIRQYSQRLEEMAVAHPTHWYNFYHFWA